MEKLRAPAEDDSTAKVVETGGAATARMLEIFRVQRADAGSDAGVLRVSEHRAEEQLHLLGKPFAERRGNGERQIGFVEMATATKADGFIQIDAEHRVRRLKEAQRVQVRHGFVRRERGAPGLRYGNCARGREGEDCTH